MTKQEYKTAKLISALREAQNIMLLLESSSKDEWAKQEAEYVRDRIDGAIEDAENE